MIWFTSDQHFGHTNIIEYANRPFRTVEEMDREMTERWNSLVKTDDVVYQLGDFTLSGYRGFEHYIEQLNGIIYFIPGGQDDRWISQYKKMEPSDKFYILPPIFLTKVKEVELVLCHYPLLSWERSHHGTIHLHGHTHGSIGCMGRSEGMSALPPGERRGNRIDVGVECNGFYPVNVFDVINKIDAFEGIVRLG